MITVKRNGIQGKRLKEKRVKSVYWSLLTKTGCKFSFLNSLSMQTVNLKVNTQDILDTIGKLCKYT